MIFYCHGSELFTIYGRWCVSGLITQVVEMLYSIPGALGLSSGQASYFSHPVTLGTQQGTMTEYCSEFNLYFSVTLWNWRMNFYKAGEYAMVQNCSIEPWYSILRVPGSSSIQAADFFHPVTQVAPNGGPWLNIDQSLYLFLCNSVKFEDDFKYSRGQNCSLFWGDDV
jgi:hypothetical protein